MALLVDDCVVLGERMRFVVLAAELELELELKRGACCELYGDCGIALEDMKGCCRGVCGGGFDCPRFIIALLGVNTGNGSLSMLEFTVDIFFVSINT